MKLVILNYHFPPDPSMGGRRWAGLGKYLARAGAEVQVVTSGERSESEQLEGGLKIHRVYRRRTLNDVYRSVAKRNQTRLASARSVSLVTQPEVKRGIVAFLRGELSAALAFPDDSRGWILNALRHTLRLVRENRPAVIISSGPPHSVHVVANLVARLHRVPHVVDLRDPWVSRVSQSPPRRHIHRAHPMLERYCFEGSDLIIANTLRLRNSLRTSYPNCRVEWIPNGVDLDGLGSSGTGCPLPGLSVAYAGTLYIGRTLNGVMAAFRKFLDENPEARRAGSRLRVAGAMERDHAIEFRYERRRLGLTEVVEHLGTLSRAESIQLTRSSSLSLVLAQDQVLQVPGKLYELAGLQRPGLVIAEAESAAADEARRLSFPRCDDDDVVAMAHAFERAWRGELSNTIKSPARLSYEDLAKEMSILLEDVSTRRP